MPHGVVTGIIFALAPTIIVGLIFWFVMRAIIHADRTERAAYGKIEAEERARFERERSGIRSATAMTAAPTTAAPGTAASTTATRVKE